MPEILEYDRLSFIVSRPVPYLSAADTALFERHGKLHIITGYPFGPTTGGRSMTGVAWCR